jgi:hypothetical protein
MCITKRDTTAETSPVIYVIVNMVDMVRINPAETG